MASVEILDDVAEHHVVVAYAEHSRLTRRAQALISFCAERLGARTPAA